MRFFLPLCFTLISLTAFAQNHLPKPVQEFLHQHAPLSTHRPVSERSGPEDCRPDSLLSYTFTSPTDSTLNAKSIWRYDGDDAEVHYFYNGDPLLLNGIDSTVYDALGRIVLETSWTFDADSNKFLVDYLTLYFPHGNTTQYDSTLNYYPDADGILQPSDKRAFFFDANNRVTEFRDYNWSSFDNNWSPAGAQAVYSYTPSGKVSKLAHNLWDGSNWYPSSEEVYSYDAKDSLTLIVTNDFGAGIPVHKEEFGYDETEQTTWSTSYSWDEQTQSWVEDFYYLYDYDAQGRVEKFEYSYSFFGFTYAGRVIYVYAGNSDCPWFTLDYSSQDGQNFDLSGKSYYFPNTPTGTQNPEAATEWTAYPNPASEYLWLEAPAGRPVRLVDLQGRTLYSGLTQGKEQLSLKGARGACLLWIGEGKKTTSRLIVVER